jgi:hypothetical protein
MRAYKSQLRTERERAGFKSARAAALTFAWPASAYAAHEAGTRRASEEQMDRYLKAFANKADPRLPKGERGASAAQMQVRMRQRSERKAVARRLVLARRLAAFDTAVAAVEHFHWRPGTYYAHEKGRHGLPEPTARQYASAFGVSAGWLIRGESPSGLAPADVATEVDELAAAFALSSNEVLPPELERLASAARRGPPSDQSSRPSTRAWSPRSRKLAFSLEAHDLVAEGDGDAQSGVWGFPSGLLSDAWGLKSDALAMLAVALDTADLKAGDRVLVDLHDTSVTAEHCFAVRRADGSVSVRGKPGAGGGSIGLGEIPVGRVVGVFRVFPD